MLAEKIKGLRRQAQMSQEQLAEKLNVSRQAVTKWETGAGVPDIDNLRSISALFHVSLDFLLDNEIQTAPPQDFLYDSTTEYDIDQEKSFDIALAGARQVTLTAYAGEKFQLRLASDQIPDIQSAFKVKLDDVKQRIDVDVHRFGDMTEAQAKASVYVFLRFPQQYVKRIEVAGSMDTLILSELRAENVEFSGKAASVRMSGVTGHVELNCNLDMGLFCESLDGRLDVNQISATSRLTLPAGTPFLAVTRGLANSIRYEKDGEPAEPFSLDASGAQGCENVIELNGMKSELVINALSAPAPGV